VKNVFEFYNKKINTLKEKLISQKSFFESKINKKIKINDCKNYFDDTHISIQRFNKNKEAYLSNSISLKSIFKSCTLANTNVVMFRLCCFGMKLISQFVSVGHFGN
jgi:hypothetical protein